MTLLANLIEVRRVVISERVGVCVCVCACSCLFLEVCVLCVHMYLRKKIVGCNRKVQYYLK